MSAPHPSWYDVLGVAPDATVDQIRAAWKSGIAELDPSDRRFRSLNSAAEVLLDADRRAAHDRDLAVGEPEQPEAPAASAAEEPSAIEPAIAPVEVPASRARSTVKDRPELAEPAGAGARLTALLGDLRTVVLLAVVALALVATTLVITLQDDDAPVASGALPGTRDIAVARAAAEAAIGPVLSYDYRQLEQDRDAALTYLSPDQRERYETFFEGVVKENAVTTQTVVTVRLIASGIVRTGVDRVDVLLFINRPTSNKERSVEYHDQVTAQMREIDGEWLVDCLITQPGRGCSDA